MWMPDDSHCPEIVQGIARALCREHSGCDDAAQRAGDFHIQQMRSMNQRVAAEPGRNLMSRIGPKQQLERRRGIQYDHRPSRALQIVTAEGSRSVTLSRVARWSRKSSMVGNSAIGVSSLTRYSESDIPFIAARVFSFR